MSTLPPAVWFGRASTLRPMSRSSLVSQRLHTPCHVFGIFTASCHKTPPGRVRTRVFHASAVTLVIVNSKGGTAHRSHESDFRRIIVLSCRKWPPKGNPNPILSRRPRPVRPHFIPLLSLSQPSRNPTKIRTSHPPLVACDVSQNIPTGRACVCVCVCSC